MTKRGFVVVSLLAVSGGLLGWHHFTAPSDDERASRQLLNRVWLDGWPRSERDQREILVLVDPPRKPTARAGAFVRASRWRAVVEGFVYTPPRAGRIGIRYPQSGIEEQARFTVSPCQGDGFSLCLELEGNTTGVHRYRSNEDLVLRPKQALDPDGLLDVIAAARD